MDWSIVAAISELVAAIVVVVSLVYVGRQVRQNTAAVKSQLNQSIARNAMDLSLETTRAPLGPVLLKAAGEFFAPLAEVGARHGLSPEEVGQLYGYFNASLRQMENRFRQAELGMLDADAYTHLGGAAVYYSWPVFHDLWPALKEGLPLDFAEFFERELGVERARPEGSRKKGADLFDEGHT